MSLDGDPTQIPNYLLKLPDPTEQIKQSLAVSQGIEQAQQQRQMYPLQLQQAQLQIQQQQMQIQRQQVMRNALANLPQNPTPEDLVRLSYQVPEINEQLMRSHKAMTEDEQAARTRQLSQLFPAMARRDTDVVHKLGDEAAAAYTNSNRPQDAKSVQGLVDAYDKDPRSGVTATGMYLLSALGPEQFTKGFNDVTQYIQAQRKSEAEAGLKDTELQKEKDLLGLRIPELQSTIFKNTAEGNQANSVGEKNRAEVAAGVPRATAYELGGRGAASYASSELTRAEIPTKTEELKANLLKAQLGNKEMERTLSGLPKELIEPVNTSMAAAVGAAQQALQMGRVRDQVLKIPEGVTDSGILAKMREGLRGLIGNQDEISWTRKQVEALRNSTVIAALKGAGRMTNAEIELISQGIPDSTSNPKLIATYLETAIGLQNKIARYNAAQAAWTSSVLSPGMATRDQDVMFEGRKIHVRSGDMPMHLLNDKADLDKREVLLRQLDKGKTLPPEQQAWLNKFNSSSSTMPGSTSTTSRSSSTLTEGQIQSAIRHYKALDPTSPLRKELGERLRLRGNDPDA